MSNSRLLSSRGRAASSGMLTKLLRGESNAAIATVQPVLWRSQAGPAASVQVPLPSVVAQPQAEQPWIPPKPSALGLDGDCNEAERAQLLARIAELERGSEQRIFQARDAAFREGEAAGRNGAAAQIQPLLDKLARSLHELSELRPKLRFEAESDLLQLALAIAHKVLHRELSIDPEALSGVVKVALEKIRLRDILRVRIHPQYHAHVGQLIAKLSAGAAIELVPDPKLELGGLIVETTRGEWDASVGTQLKEIERGLADRLLR